MPTIEIKNLGGQISPKAFSITVIIRTQTIINYNLSKCQLNAKTSMFNFLSGIVNFAKPSLMQIH